ncbi:MAG: VWA domain-containing protein [Cohaesibacteraceae bacterium]
MPKTNPPNDNPPNTKAPVKGAGQSKPAPRKQGSVAAFIDALDRAPKAANAGRLMFARDATLSRERTWDRAMHIQSAMFAEAASVNGLAMKLVYFRGYNECRASKWVQDGPSLMKLMQGITTLGGQTQISRVLGFARKEVAKAPVPAMVYIGDAVEEDPDWIGKQAGELGLLGCRIFAFHEGHDHMAGATFQTMARNSGGGYFQFDERSASQLADLLKAVARYASGGRKALESGSARANRLLLEQLR